MFHYCWLKNIKFFPLSGGRVEWTSRCVLLMTAAATKTAMPRTAGQRPVWTHRCLLWYEPTETLCGISVISQLFLCHNHVRKNPPVATSHLPSCAEQAELIVVGPGHCRGGLGSVGWLQRVLAGAAEAAGGSPGGAGSGSTHGPHAGGGGKTNSAAQTLSCGWPG